MATATAALAIKDALAQGIAVALADHDPYGQLLIRWGWPDPEWADDMVLLMGTSSTQEWRTSNRAREEVTEVEVHFIAWRGGDGAASQRDAEHAAYALLEAVDRYCRVTDPTLALGVPGAGVCRELVLSSHSAEGFTSKSDGAAGRGVEIVAVFRAAARIRG